MSSMLKPRVTITLGGQERVLMMGFGEVARFEDEFGKSFAWCFGDGKPGFNAIIKFVEVGLRKTGKLKRAEICAMLDENAHEMVPITEAIGELAQKFFPDAPEEDDGPLVIEAPRLETAKA